MDLDKWRDGEWKNWDRDKWLREAKDFVNPIIEDLWDPERMRHADKAPENPVERRHLRRPGRDRPEPPRRSRPRTCRRRTTRSAPESGKLLFDGPEGSMVCSAPWCRTRRTRASPTWSGRRGIACTPGKNGGWYRNIAFVPSYNDSGTVDGRAAERDEEEIAPYGVWWADWAQTSDQWIKPGRRDRRPAEPRTTSRCCRCAGEGSAASRWRRPSARRCRWIQRPGRPGDRRA